MADTPLLVHTILSSPHRLAMPIITFPGARLAHTTVRAMVTDPLKQWKLSPMDLESRVRWEAYTHAKEVLLERTNIPEAPWWVVQAVDKKTARLLGAQAFGRAGVDKRIDVLATALAGKLTLHDLAELDLVYAPPYSTANDPVNLAAFIGLNDISGFSPLVSAADLKTELAQSTPPLVLDVRTLGEYEASHLAGAMYIPVDDVRYELERLPRNRRIVVLCRSGFRAHLAVRVLKENGFADVANLTGGHLSMLAEGGFHLETS